jgi:selenocysteine-specific elongation factor
LAAHPLRSPSRDQLDGWALTPRDLADAAERGEIVRLGGVVLAGDAVGVAEEVVRRLPQPFAVGDATRALGTSRRVAVPLLERLDTAMVTRRLADGRREVRPAQAGRQPVTP